MKRIFAGALRLGTFDINRLAAFSDGVFAIVATLLVLDIRLPQGDGSGHGRLAAQLFALLPKILSYVLSFTYIAIYWFYHHQLFSLVRFCDRGLCWLNCLFLLTLAFIPFPTAVIGEHPGDPAAVIFYGVVMLLVAASFAGMKVYVTRGRMFHVLPGNTFVRDSLFKLLAGPVLYGMALASAAMWSTRLAIALYILIPIVYFFPSEIERKELAAMTQLRGHN